MSQVDVKNPNVALTVGAVVATAVVGRFAWKRLKNRKAKK